MRTRILSVVVPMTALIAGAAIAAPTPVWYRDGDETRVRGFVTDVDPSGTQVVIEDRDRIYIAPTAQIAMADVRPGTEVEARYVQAGNGEKSMLSMVPVFHEFQSP